MTSSRSLLLPVATSTLRWVLVLAAVLLVAPVTARAATAAQVAPWEVAAEVRTLLADAEKALILEGPEEAAAQVDEAVEAAAPLLTGLREAAPGAADRLTQSLEAAGAAAAAGDPAGLAAARADAWTAVLAGAYRATLDAVAAGEAERARAWLLVRDFRRPTRFSRPGADATLALQGLSEGRTTPVQAVPLVRADLLDTYQARLRAAVEAADVAVEREYWVRAAAETALARGYGAILDPSYRSQRGAAGADRLAAALAAVAAAALATDVGAYASARAQIDEALLGFRAAPLSNDEQLRRAGQLQRFLALVPVEYGRGVKDGRVTKDFEIQEAITFREGAAQAFGDLESILLERDEAATRRMGELIGTLGDDLAAAARGDAVVEPDAIEATTAEVLGLAESIFPPEWKDAGAAADFDVISGALDRIEGAVEAGRYADAEQARLEAYAFFEFGPEQRLRGLAPGLFVTVEGLFWYGDGDVPGLARLVKLKATPQEVAATRAALDDALADAEAAVGAGPKSTASVVTNTSVIVFREGLEAVLIVAALMAGMVGAQRRFRRPLLWGVAGAFVATAATWLIAHFVLGSLSRYGEKLEAIVSVVAIAVLLLILNWFYHKVYWNDRLAGFHGRKKRLVKAGIVGAATAQLVGLVALGFSSVYREGFETVLFLQALVLEAGVGSVLLGVGLGLVAVLAVAVLVFALERKLPHRKMLIATGVLILAVLVVMVGQTVQVLQVVGWLPVHPISGLQLPYWAGLWLGVYPTWEGLGAQLVALAFVLGSYFLAEGMRTRKRRRILAAPVGARPPRESAGLPAPGAVAASEQVTSPPAVHNVSRSPVRWRPGPRGTGTEAQSTDGASSSAPRPYQIPNARLTTPSTGATRLKAPRTGRLTRVAPNPVERIVIETAVKSASTTSAATAVVVDSTVATTSTPTPALPPIP